VHVQPGTLDNGDTWYRVMIGPYASKEALRAAQTRLAARNVETLPIQVKGQ
jgi:cell division protein FtsN